MAALRAWALLAAGVGWHSGQWSLGLVLVLAAAWVLGRAVLAGGDRAPSAPDLVWPAVVAGFAVVAWRPVWYASGPWLPVAHLLAALAVLAALVAVRRAVAVPRPGGRSLRSSLLPAGAAPRHGVSRGSSYEGRGAGAGALAAGALAVAGAVAMVTAAPRPSIDVWVFQQQAGLDMYRQVWVGSPGLQDVYPYLPGTWLALWPARELLGDVRWGLVAATLVAAGATWALARTCRAAAPVALAAPLLLVVLPRWSWSVAQAWTEPLLLAGLGVAVAALAERDRARPGSRRAAGAQVLAVLGVAAALACKQHVWLLVPLLARPGALGRRGTLAAVVLGGAVSLPWFLAAPAAFWSDAVAANLGLEPQRRSLGLASLALHVGLPWGFLVSVPALVAAVVLVRRRLPDDLHGLCLGGAAVLLVVDLVNQQTYFNHYLLPLALLLWAALLAPVGRDTDTRRTRTHSGTRAAG